MQIKVDNDNLIVAFAEVGSLDGGIDVHSPIPDTFISMFRPYRFKYVDGKIEFNQDYVDGTEVVELKKDNLTLEEKVARLEEEIEQLKNNIPPTE